MGDVTKVCAVCKERSATHIYTAHVREDGPIEEAPVCDECYRDLVLLDRHHVHSTSAG